MVPNVTVIYCLCYILLFIENLDTHCLGTEFLNLDRLGCQWIYYKFVCSLTMNISLKNVTFTTASALFVTGVIKSVT